VAFFAVINFPVQALSDRVTASVNNTCNALFLHPGKASFRWPLGLAYDDGELRYKKDLTLHPRNLAVAVRLSSLFSSLKELAFGLDLAGGRVDGVLAGVSLGRGNFTSSDIRFRGVEVRGYPHRAGSHKIELSFDLDGTCEFDPGAKKAAGKLVLNALSISLEKVPEFKRMGLSTLVFDRAEISLTVDDGRIIVSNASARGPMMDLTLKGQITREGGLKLSGKMHPTPSMVSKISRVADVRELFGPGRKADKGIPLTLSGTVTAPQIACK